MKSSVNISLSIFFFGFIAKIPKFYDDSTFVRFLHFFLLNKNIPGISN